MGDAVSELVASLHPRSLRYYRYDPDRDEFGDLVEKTFPGGRVNTGIDFTGM